MESPCVVLLGNRCDHDPLNPQFFTAPESHKRRPDVLQYATSNLEQFYTSPKQWLKSLRLSRESARQARSEGRERDADVLGVLLHYAELATLRCGVPTQKGFINLTLSFIAKQLGWRSDEDEAEDRARNKAGQRPRNRGIKRVWRSLRVLKKAGYVSITRLCKTKDGKHYQGLAAIKCLSTKLFKELGISGTKLEAKRREASKRLKKRLQEAALEAKSALVSGLQLELGFGEGKRARRPQSACEAQTAMEKEKARLKKCQALLALPENAELTAEALYIKYPELRRRE